MMRSTLIAVILLLPGLALGATLEGQRNVLVTEAPPDNIYIAGADVRIVAPVTNDLTAAGANVTVSAPVTGDVLLAGGTLDLEKSVGGDVRVAGGRVIIDSAVSGDLAVLGGVVLVSGRAKDIQMMGGTVRVTGGADGNVNIYGSDVFLSGEYMGNVSVSASDRVTLAEGTVIHGAFRYNAPQEAIIPPGAVIDSGVQYTGAASYLPSAKEAQTFALAGAGIFFLVKALAALVAAGLVVGLFPAFSRRVVERTQAGTPKRYFMLALLGFALVVATPILLILLLISFVGIGLAFILGALYLLLLMLAYIYAGLLAGMYTLKLITKKEQTGWKAAVLGMFMLYVIGLVPVVGSLFVFVLMLVSAGVLAIIAYTFAWKRDEATL